MTDDLVEWLRSSAGEYGNARCDEAADRIEELENDLKLLRQQNREQRYTIERLKTPENERNLLGLPPLRSEKKDG
jgi:hypothetical protein